MEAVEIQLDSGEQKEDLVKKLLGKTAKLLLLTFAPHSTCSLFGVYLNPFFLLSSVPISNLSPF